MKTLTPLRYPGGKSCLYDFLANLIDENQFEGGIYAEPYAGGAGAALLLLMNEHVDKILINDKDIHIFSFWKSILNTAEEFCKRIDNIPLNIVEWNRQRYIYEHVEEFDEFDIGFSTFYLNRCNRSGILMNAGPIGGKRQTGKWKINARFNRSDLIKKIERINFYRDRIKVYGLDAVMFLDRIKNYKTAETTLVYLDPPYYKKGASLYLNHYTHKDHSRLAQYLTKELKFCWILTYDNAPEIRELYQSNRQLPFTLNYSVAQKKEGMELLVCDDRVLIPEQHQMGILT